MTDTDTTKLNTTTIVCTTGATEEGDEQRVVFHIAYPKNQGLSVIAAIAQMDKDWRKTVHHFLELEDESVQEALRTTAQRMGSNEQQEEPT